MAAQTKVKFARLSREQLAEVKRLEEELGTVVIAFKSPPRPAKLTQKQLARLRKAEKAMPGVCLVAYEADSQG